MGSLASFMGVILLSLHWHADNIGYTDNTGYTDNAGYTLVWIKEQSEY